MDVEGDRRKSNAGDIPPMKSKLRELSTVGIVLRIIRRISLLDALAQHVVRRMVTSARARARLNRFYNTLDFDELSVFHGVFSKTFHHDHNPLAGSWSTRFMDKEIRMPLRPGLSSLDWENAVSILGHDADVKQTYQTLLSSKKFRPSTFFDVGANYGTHALLFLRHGVEAIAFEPNPACKIQFEALCRLNDLAGRMELLAVGEREGTADFWVPEKATWHGTVLEETKQHLAGMELQHMRVPLATLDAYCTANGIGPDLIKIDTEGNEVNVLDGAGEILRTRKPLVIFEANVLSSKEALWDAFEPIDYAVSALPLLPDRKVAALSRHEFLVHEGINFMALPQSHALLVEAEVP